MRSHGAFMRECKRSAAVSLMQEPQRTLDRVAEDTFWWQKADDHERLARKIKKVTRMYEYALAL